MFVHINLHLIQFSYLFIKRRRGVFPILKNLSHFPSFVFFMLYYYLFSVKYYNSLSQSETGGSSTCLSAASMARVAESFGDRLTHLTLANNKFTALPQILTTVAVSIFPIISARLVAVLYLAKYFCDMNYF